MTPAPEKCFITDLPTTDLPSSTDAIQYQIVFNGSKLQFICPYDHQNSKFVEENKYIIKGLLANGKIPFEGSYFDNTTLEKVIIEAQIPKTPKEKLDNLISYLFKLQSHEGSNIKFNTADIWDITLSKLYFRNHEEYWFYLNSLRDLGFITFTDISDMSGSNAMNIRISFKGLEYIINLQENGTQSRNCFIAMSFNESEEVKAIRSTIKDAIIECGYKPILIDEEHVDSDITINDAIISCIKKSKFLIGDFTEQKHGVYFEAGYALGLKKPVIYTCHEDYFRNSHFDTNHYPHIIYSDLSKFKQQLVDKIQAWIN